MAFKMKNVIQPNHKPHFFLCCWININDKVIDADRSAVDPHPAPEVRIYVCQKLEILQ